MFYNYSRYDPIIVNDKAENNTQKEEKLLNETATDKGDKVKAGDEKTVIIDKEEKKDDDDDDDVKGDQKKDANDPKRFITEDGEDAEKTTDTK